MAFLQRLADLLMCRRADYPFLKDQTTMLMYSAHEPNRLPNQMVMCFGKAITVRKVLIAGLTRSRVRMSLRLRQHGCVSFFALRAKKRNTIKKENNRI